MYYDTSPSDEPAIDSNRTGYKTWFLVMEGQEIVYGYDTMDEARRELRPGQRIERVEERYTIHCYPF